MQFHTKASSIKILGFDCHDISRCLLEPKIKDQGIRVFPQWWASVTNLMQNQVFVIHKLWIYDVYEKVLIWMHDTYEWNMNVMNPKSKVEWKDERWGQILGYDTSVYIPPVYHFFTSILICD